DDSGVRRRQADRERAHDGATDEGSARRPRGSTSIRRSRTVDRTLRARGARPRPGEAHTAGALQRHVGGDGGARKILPAGRALHVRAVEHILHEPAALHHRARDARSVRDHRPGARDHRPGRRVNTETTHASEKSLTTKTRSHEVAEPRLKPTWYSLNSVLEWLREVCEHSPVALPR